MSELELPGQEQEISFAHKINPIAENECKFVEVPEDQIQKRLVLIEAENGEKIEIPYVYVAKVGTPAIGKNTPTYFFYQSYIKHSKKSGFINLKLWQPMEEGLPPLLSCDGMTEFFMGTPEGEILLLDTRLMFDPKITHSNEVMTGHDFLKGFFVQFEKKRYFMGSEEYNILITHKNTLEELEYNDKIMNMTESELKWEKSELHKEIEQTNKRIEQIVKDDMSPAGLEASKSRVLEKIVKIESQLKEWEDHHSEKEVLPKEEESNEEHID